MRHALKNKSVASSVKHQREIFVDNLSTQPYIFNSLRSIKRRAHQFNSSFLRQLCTMRTRWGNRKIVTIAQMYFQLSDVSLAIVVIIAKAPYCLAFFLFKGRSGKLSFPIAHLSYHFITMSLHKLFISVNYVQETN